MRFHCHAARICRGLLLALALLSVCVPSFAQEADEPVLDRDETAEGLARLVQVTSRARDLYAKREELMRERRPLALVRDPLAANMTKARAENVQAQTNINACNVQAQKLNNKLQFAIGEEARAIQRQIDTLQQQTRTLGNVIAANNAFMEREGPNLAALNRQIAPLDLDLSKAWNELEEARNQWLEIRQPLDKFSRGEYENLRKVLDDWLLIDGLWPWAFYWGGLCAYELGDIEAAQGYVDKAEHVRVIELGMTEPVSDGEAIIGLIHTRMGGKHAARAKERFSKAVRLSTKRPSWFTNFLIGRCYAEREQDCSRAKAEFEKSLKIKPNNPCARIWLARLQTTAKKDSVRDVATGTKTLELVWRETGKRSWRLGYFLVEAYVNGDRDSEAKVLWDSVLPMAPFTEQDELKEKYAKLTAG